MIGARNTNNTKEQTRIQNKQTYETHKQHENTIRKDTHKKLSQLKQHMQQCDNTVLSTIKRKNNKQLCNNRSKNTSTTRNSNEQTNKKQTIQKEKTKTITEAKP